MRVSKYSGAGNTFIFVLSTEAYNLPYKRSDIAKVLCHDVWGVAADGCVFIDGDKSQKMTESATQIPDIVWDFYNADGSNAEMCGNAIRCAGLYCLEKITQSTKMNFITRAGRIFVDVLQKNQHQAWVKVQMTKPVVLNKQLEVLSHKGYFINTGVPHFVIPILQRSDAESIKSLLPKIRHHSVFGEAGTNVTLYCAEDSLNLKEFGDKTIPQIFAVSYERGVEDYTLACGTGAVAAALAFHDTTDARVASTHVRMPGGMLRIDHDWGQELVLMLGPATQIAEIEYNLESVLKDEVVLEKLKINHNSVNNAL